MPKLLYERALHRIKFVSSVSISYREAPFYLIDSSISDSKLLLLLPANTSPSQPTGRRKWLWQFHSYHLKLWLELVYIISLYVLLVRKIPWPHTTAGETGKWSFEAGGEIKTSKIGGENGYWTVSCSVTGSIEEYYISSA